MFCNWKNKLKLKKSRNKAKTGVCIDTDSFCIDTDTGQGKNQGSVSIQNVLYRYRMICIDTDFQFSAKFTFEQNILAICIDTDYSVSIQTWNSAQFHLVSPFHFVINPNLFRTFLYYSETSYTTRKTSYQVLKKKKFIPQVFKVRFNSDHPKCDPMWRSRPGSAQAGLGRYIDISSNTFRALSKSQFIKI